VSLFTSEIRAGMRLCARSNGRLWRVKATSYQMVTLRGVSECYGEPREITICAELVRGCMTVIPSRSTRRLEPVEQAAFF